MQKCRLTGKKRSSLLSGLFILLLFVLSGCTSLDLHPDTSSYFSLLPAEGSLYAFIPVSHYFDFISNLTAQNSSIGKLLKNTKSMYVSVSTEKEYCIIASGSYPSMIYSLFLGLSSDWLTRKEKTEQYTYTYYESSSGINIAFPLTGAAVISNASLSTVFAAADKYKMETKYGNDANLHFALPIDTHVSTIQFYTDKPETFIAAIFNKLIEFAMENISGTLQPYSNGQTCRLDAVFTLTDARAVKPALVLFKIAVKAVSLSMPEIPVVIEAVDDTKISLKNVFISTSSLKSLL